MLSELITLALLTWIPFLELRYTIPAGILNGTVNLPFGMALHGYGLNWFIVFCVCVISNILIGIIIYFLLDRFVKFFLRYKWFTRTYNKIIAGPQKKIKKAVDKYGTFGVAIFIGIPLPGSGVYSGALGAYAIGLGFKKFIIANIIGVLIVGIVVTIITLVSSGIASAL